MVYRVSLEKLDVARVLANQDLIGIESGEADTHLGELFYAFISIDDFFHLFGCLFF